MVRRLSLLAAVAFTGLSVPSSADAQGTLYLQGGGTFPTNDYGNEASTGWMAIGGYVFDVSGGISLGIEGFYGSNSHDEEAEFFLDGDKTDLYGGYGTVSYFFQLDSQIQPYVFGGLGWLVHDFKSDGSFSGSSNGFSWEFGGGVGFPLSESISIYGEGRYMSASTGDEVISYTTALWGLFAGLAFEL